MLPPAMGRCVSPPRIKSSLLAKCRGKAFNFIFPFPKKKKMSKRKCNKSLPPCIKHLGRTHASTCLGANSRECNVEEEVNTHRIDGLLERNTESRTCSFFLLFL